MRKSISPSSPLLNPEVSVQAWKEYVEILYRWKKILCSIKKNIWFNFNPDNNTPDMLYSFQTYDSN